MRRTPGFATHEGDDREGEAPPDAFRDVARRVRSRFFSMDVAKKRTGDWTIVELGDGQVAGLPGHVDRLAFFAAIKARVQTV